MTAQKSLEWTTEKIDMLCKEIEAKKQYHESVAQNEELPLIARVQANFSVTDMEYLHNMLVTIKTLALKDIEG